MNKLSLILFCICSLLVGVYFTYDALSFTEQITWSILLILALGIPHGAIDHVLILEQKKTKPQLFYLLYLGSILLYIIGWITFSYWSMVFFLLISAYHFGQSQFSDLINMPKVDASIIYFLWGTSILAALFTYNHQDLIAIFQSSPDLAEVGTVFEFERFDFLLTSSTILTVLFIGYLLYRKHIDLKRAIFEWLSLALIHICFYTLPLLISFTIYFTTLHSLKVLSEEFAFLKSTRINFSLSKFIRLLLPYSIISIIGTILLIFISYLGWFSISNVLLVFILLSVITLPHSIVMDRFYDRFYKA